jgi:hypothetical protein
MKRLNLIVFLAAAATGVSLLARAAAGDTGSRLGARSTSPSETTYSHVAWRS